MVASMTTPPRGRLGRPALTLVEDDSVVAPFFTALPAACCDPGRERECGDGGPGNATPTVCFDSG
jgi:hypothetical protein